MTDLFDVIHACNRVVATVGDGHWISVVCERITRATLAAATITHEGELVERTIGHVVADLATVPTVSL